MKKPAIIIEFEKTENLHKKISNEIGREYPFNAEEEIRKAYDRIINIPKGFGINLNRPKFDQIRLFQLQEAVRYYDSKEKERNDIKEKRKHETSTRTVALTFYYLSKVKRFPYVGSDLKQAEFIHYLTGKNVDTLRKIIGNPLGRKKDKTGRATKELIKVLNDVLNQLKIYQFNDVEQEIRNDIKLLENDLNSFND